MTVHKIHEAEQIYGDDSSFQSYAFSSKFGYENRTNLLNPNLSLRKWSSNLQKQKKTSKKLKDIFRLIRLY